jgi:hypothetical protein
MLLRERTYPGLGIIEPCLPLPAKAPFGSQIDDQLVFVRSPRRQRRPRQARGKTKQRSGVGDQLGSRRHRPVVVRQRHAARFRDAAAVGNKTAHRLDVLHDPRLQEIESMIGHRCPP